MPPPPVWIGLRKRVSTFYTGGDGGGQNLFHIFIQYGTQYFTTNNNFENILNQEKDFDQPLLVLGSVRFKPFF